MAEGNANLPIVKKDWSFTGLSDTILSQSAKQYTFDIGITGLTPIGICRVNKWGANNSRAAITDFYFNSNNPNQAIVNLTNFATLSCDISAVFLTVLYM